MHRLLPLSPAELTQLNISFDLDKLINRSGFPGPFLTDEALDARRWRMQYIQNLLSTDVFEFDKAQVVKHLRHSRKVDTIDVLKGLDFLNELVL